MEVFVWLTLELREMHMIMKKMASYFMLHHPKQILPKDFTIKGNLKHGMSTKEMSD